MRFVGEADHDCADPPPVYRQRGIGRRRRPRRHADSAGGGTSARNDNVRLPRIPAVCIAPQYVAEELLRAEGFTDVRYVDGTPGSTELVARGEVDFDSNYASNFGQGIDRGEPITLLSGVMVGCFELFARESVRTIADLKGRSVGIQALGSSPHVLLTLMTAELGLDPAKNIHWVTDPKAKPIERFIEGRIDAFLGFPPEPQELCARHIGHVLVNSRGPPVVAIFLLHAGG